MDDPERVVRFSLTGMIIIGILPIPPSPDTWTLRIADLDLVDIFTDDKLYLLPFSDSISAFSVINGSEDRLCHLCRFGFPGCGFTAT